MDSTSDEFYTPCPTPSAGSPHSGSFYSAAEDEREQQLQQALYMAKQLRETVEAAYNCHLAADLDALAGKAHDMVTDIQKALKKKPLVPDEESDMPNTDYWSPKPQPTDSDNALQTAGQFYQSNARLVIGYPPESRPLLSKYPDILLQSKADRYDQFLTVPAQMDAYAIVQRGANPSVRLPLPPKDQDPHSVELQVVFDPTRDGCFFKHSGTSQPPVLFTNLKNKDKEEVLPGSRTTFISSGCWSVSSDVGVFKPINILIRKRLFTVSIRRRAPAKSMRKRQPTDELEGDERARRQKGDNGYTSKPRDTVNNQAATVTTLNKGDTADICDQVAAGPTYRLRMIDYIHRGNRSTVFKCTLSGYPGIVAAKTFIRDKGQCTHKSVKSWTVEATLLKGFKHENIVKVIGVDSRIFTIYEEVLPLSLAKQETPFPLLDCLNIVQHMSSALKYLRAQRVIHHDVKPDNIAYSRQRGAVLFDFELSNGSARDVGGTPRFMPPEFISSSKSGFHGDIWALGITMLYATGKVDPCRRWNWLLWQVLIPGHEANKEMKSWLQEINGVRSQLADTLSTQPNQAELLILIHQMLNPNPDERVGVVELHKATQSLAFSECTGSESVHRD